MKSIISVDGGKGGTGKSVTCTAIIDTALTCNKSVLLIEADTSNPDVAKCYSSVVETIPLCLDFRESFIELANTVNKSEADVIIISNPARSEKWSEFGNIFVSNLNRLNARMTVLWVANIERDSVELCNNFFEKYPMLPVFFCMNEHHGPAAQFDVWLQSNLRKRIFDAGGGELVIIEAAERVMKEMKNQRLRWDQIEKLDIGDLFEAERVRNEFNEIFTPFVA